jgi:endonuclease YncB( thermonuclease family)
MHGFAIRLFRVIRLSLAVLAVSLAASAADERDSVVRALSGTTVELDDGRVVRLAGIRVPGGAGTGASEPQVAAHAVLAALIDGRVVRLDVAQQERDRHGRLVAQVWRDDGLWLQGALLEQGLVQVQTRPGEVAQAAEMAVRENAARGVGAGVWGDPRFAVRSAERARDLVGGFGIVRGRVVRAAATRSFVYLNFGADWRSDFTLRVANKLARSLKKAGLDLEMLAGKEVEVRGYVLEAGGPLIELSHREQIRIEPEAVATGS